MLEELDRLRESEGLYDLLHHYAWLGDANPEAWQDRLMEAEGVNARELIQFHGLLIAFGWIGQNTGSVPVLKRGTVPSCYRATAAGHRALAAVGRIEGEEIRESSAAA